MTDKKSNLKVHTLEQTLLPSEEAPLRAQTRGTWGRFFASFKYASHGLWYALRTQRNARVHSALALIAILVGLLLRISALELALIVVVISGVFVAEMFNTAIESCVDLVSPGYHPLAKIAKDVAAGAVLFSALVAVVVGLLVFVPHLWPILQSLF